jgi:serine/threonine protein kinase/WD40 repeat protein
MSGSSEDLTTAALLFEFVCRFLADADAGSIRSLDEYQAEFPGHADAIAAEYRRLLTNHPPAVAERDVWVGRELGHYRLLEPLGSGGQGTVFLAEDRELSRRVAIKILAPHLDFVSSERRQRFVREATVLAQLDHPAICQVFAAESTELGAYIVMRHVPGESLAQVLKREQAVGDVPRTRARIHGVLSQFEILARALHEAHVAGVLHRDIKPGNVMIETDGSPVILDFGLARTRHDADDAITRSGDVLGTLPYMAPELLTGTFADASPQSDVYALGVTLQQALTHKLPFAAATHAGLVREITNGAVVDLRRQNPALPAELGLVLAGAMARDPTRRYRDAAAFADDLLRIRRREAVLVRPAPKWLVATRWVQRHPTLTVALAALVVLSVLLAIGLHRVRQQRRAATAMHRALEAVTSDEDAGLALEELIDTAGESPSPELMSAIARVLDASQLAWQRTRTPIPFHHVDPSPALSADGRYVAQGDSQGRIELLDVTSGHRLADRALAGAITALGFLGSTRLFAATADRCELLTIPQLTPCTANALASDDLAKAAIHAFAHFEPAGVVALGSVGDVFLVDASLERVLARIGIDDRATLRRLRFAPEGRRLAVLGKVGGDDFEADDTLYIVDVQERLEVHRRRLVDEQIQAFAWSPDGSRFAFGGNGGTLEVVDAHSFATNLRLDVGEELHWIDFSPDGDSIMVPTDRRTEFWDCRSPSTTPWRSITHRSGRTIGAAGFDATGRYFAAVHRDGTVQILETSQWRLLRCFQQPMLNVRYMVWLPDAAGVLTADMNRLLAWHGLEREHAAEVFAHDDEVTAVMLAKGRAGHATVLVSAARDGRLHRCELPAGRASVVTDYGDPIHGAAIAGELVFVWRGRSTIECYAVRGLARLGILDAHRAEVLGVIVAANEEWMVSYAADGEAIVWDLPALQVRRRLAAGDSPIRSVCIDERDEVVAIGNAGSELSVFDPRTGDCLHRARACDVVVDWRTNPFYQIRGLCRDSLRRDWCLSLVNVSFVRFDPEREWARSVIQEQRFGGVAVDAGNQGVQACADYSFGRLSLVRGDRLVPLRIGEREAHRNRITALLTSSDGHSIVSTGLDGRVVHWRVDEERATLVREMDAPVTAATFGPNERSLILGLGDGRLRILPSDPLETARAVSRSRRLQGR